jgi:hypothetical protein
MVRFADIWAQPWQRRGLIALIIVVLYGAAGFLLAPWLIERTLTSTLSQRLSLNAQVGDLQLNPFSLSLKVDDLKVDEAEGETLLVFDRLFINFQLSSVFRWAWSFDEIHLIRPHAHFERLTETDSNITELAARWAATGPAPEPESPAASAAVTSIPRLVIADLRIIEGALTIVDQAAGEPFSTDLAPIDLELADFSTLPDRSGRQQVTVRTESGAEIGMTGSLSVNPLALAGTIRLEGTYTPMLFRYFRDELALPLTFDGGAITASFDYRVAMDDTGELSAFLTNVTGRLTGLNVNQPDHPHLVELGELSLAGGSLMWPDQVVRIERIALNDLLLRPFRAADGSYLPIEPAPDLTDNREAGPTATEEGIESVAEDAARWQIDVAEIALNRGRLIHTDMALENGATEISSLNLLLQAFSLEEGGEMPLAIELAIAPGGTLGLDGKLQLFPAPRLTSTLTANELPLAAAQPYLSSIANIAIEDGHLSLGGEFSVGEDPSFSYQGSLQLGSLSLIDRAQEEALFSWEALSIDRLSVTPNAAELSILSIEAPYARIEIEPDGSTNIERTFIDADPADEPPSDVTEAARDDGAGFDVTVGETRITGGSANFTDLALPLPFQADITRIEGDLSTFATNSAAPSRVDLGGQINEYGALSIDGSISASAPTAATDITVRFDNVNLPRMTPYTIKFAGRTIADGRTDLTLSYRLEDGALEGDNRLVIRDLTLGEKVEQEGAMDLPLDMAVALLKDGEGNVDFSFPVSGSIDDPEFSYSGAVMTAFSNVIGGIVAAPFRFLGSLVGMAPDELEHIGFEPGEATITPPQRETLAKLAEALGQRPQLVLEVAPVRNLAADRAAVAELLVDAEIEAILLETQKDDQSHTEALRDALEALFDAEKIAVSRDDLAAAHTITDTAGEATLDVPAYNTALRQTLIEAQEVPEPDLNALAIGRLDAIHEALTGLVPLPEERLRALPLEDVELNEDGLVQMSLNVTIAD